MPDRTCTWCGETKPATEFSRASNQKDGINRWCKDCKKDKEIQRLFGITYNALVEKYGNSCGICGKSEDAQFNGRATRLCVDHDHTTGEVRGLLCRACNAWLGVYENHPGWFAKADAYLTLHGGQ